MVPDTLNIRLQDALEESADLKQVYDTDPQVHEMIDIAVRLEGLARSAGTHAAGVVVADQPLVNYIPLQTITGKDDVITQWDGPRVEMAGLLKMDFLGLRNLTILDKAVRNVRKHRGHRDRSGQTAARRSQRRSSCCSGARPRASSSSKAAGCATC